MDGFYPGRGQTQAKHAILQRYLEVFAFKVGTTFGSFDFIDGFSGPWQERDKEAFSDTSFGIALRQLQLAAEKLLEKGHRVSIRCIFNEKDTESYNRLTNYLEKAATGYPLVEVHALHGEFAENVDLINTLAKSQFRFLFIDPTGWTGFPPAAIERILSGYRSEIIVNFMQEHITRFLTSPTDAQENGLIELLGPQRAKDMIGKYHTINEIEEAYRRMMREDFLFRFVASSPIYMENSDKLHFRLMYGSNHPAGVDLLREVEVKSLNEHDDRKARLKENPLQPSLFETSEDFKSGPYREARREHLRNLKQDIAFRLSSQNKDLTSQRLQAEIQCDRFVRSTEIKGAIASLAVDGLVEPTWKLRGQHKKKPDKLDKIFLIER